MQAFHSLQVKIRDIGPGNDNLSLTGLIIRKQEPRVVQTKKDNSERGVWSFTLRDSPSDMMNVSIWGSVDYVKNLYHIYKVGDVVNILNAKAIFRKIGDNDDLYQPLVTSSFYASLNEDQSQIKLYDGADKDEYKKLLQIPSKPAGNFLTISDVHRHGEILRGQFINLLAAVQDVGQTRQFQTRDGRACSCLEVRLIDHSYSTLSLTIWGADLIQQCQSWIPRNTVLFLADVRADWNIFRRIMILTTTGRTIITENPRTVAAENLKKFAMSTSIQNLPKLDQLGNKYADPSVINTITSCAGVIAKAMDEKQNTEFTALVYAAINTFNVDENDNVIVTKCLRCNSKIDLSLELCLNADCPSGTGVEKPSIDQVYDIRISLVDHTGMLMNCKLTNAAAQKIIGYEASVFKTLEGNEKTELKWKYQLNYCAARLVVLPMRQRSPLISILSIDMISLAEYSSQIPMC